MSNGNNNKTSRTGAWTERINLVNSLLTFGAIVVPMIGGLYFFLNDSSETDKSADTTEVVANTPEETVTKPFEDKDVKTPEDFENEEEKEKSSHKPQLKTEIANKDDEVEEVKVLIPKVELYSWSKEVVEAGVEVWFTDKESGNKYSAVSDSLKNVVLNVPKSLIGKTVELHFRKKGEKEDRRLCRVGGSLSFIR